MYSCHLFLISSASVRSILFLSFIEPIFAWNVPLVSLIFLKYPYQESNPCPLHWQLGVLTRDPQRSPSLSSHWLCPSKDWGEQGQDSEAFPEADLEAAKIGGRGCLIVSNGCCKNYCRLNGLKHMHSAVISNLFSNNLEKSHKIYREKCKELVNLNKEFFVWSLQLFYKLDTMKFFLSLNQLYF